MELSAVHSQIVNKNLQHFYIFYGEEAEVQKIYVKQIALTAGLQLVSAETVVDVYNKLKHKSIISKAACYSVFNDTDFTTQEQLWGNIAEVLGDNILILRLISVDKRTKFYNQYKNTIVEFEPLKEAVLKRYIKKEIELSDRNCEKLIEVCESDYSRILLEIDKIKRFESWNTAPNITADDCFQVLLEEGAIYRPPRDVIFDFSDAVLDRSSRMFPLYEECRESGEAVFVMLSVLYNNVRAVLQVQSCDDEKDIMKTTGLTYPQVMSAKKHLKRYSTEELLNFLELIRKVESGIKSGLIDEKYAIDYILLEELC